MDEKGKWMIIDKKAVEQLEKIRNNSISRAIKCHQVLGRTGHWTESAITELYDRLLGHLISDSNCGFLACGNLVLRKSNFTEDIYSIDVYFNLFPDLPDESKNDN